MDEHVAIATLENEVEAMLLESLLKAQGIPHVIQSFRDPAYDGMFQLQKGWGCVVAAADRREEILSTLNALRQTSLEAEEPTAGG